MSYDLKAAAKHIVHDYAFLVAAGLDTQKPLGFPLNHYAERTFLVHCRAFAKFFDTDGSDPRDMYAKDFIDQPVDPRRLETWKKWHDHVSKHLAHLSTSRITNTEPWTGEDNKKVLEEFQDMWQDFYTKVKPDVRSAFDAEIAKMQQTFR